MSNLRRVCGVYRITNTRNGHFYVGSSKNIGKRITQHKVDLRRNAHHSPYLQRAWNKYGEESFEFSLIEECSIDDALDREQYYLDSLCPAYNVSADAVSPMKDKTHSPAVVEKIKAKLHSMFTKDQLVQRAKHANSYAQLPESREHHKESVSLSFTPERISKIKKIQLELWKTDEHKTKMSNAHKHYTDEIKKKFSDAQKKLWENPDNRERFSIARRGKGRAKYTVEEVQKIRSLHFSDGLSAREISEMLGKKYASIRSVLYSNWEWLE